jgi:hypothetical protein
MQRFSISISTLRPSRLCEIHQLVSHEFEVLYDSTLVAMRVQTA